MTSDFLERFTPNAAEYETRSLENSRVKVFLYFLPFVKPDPDKLFLYQMEAYKT